MNWQGPEPEQERLFWKALWLLALFFIIAAGLAVGWVLLSILKFLQDVLIPVAVAAILAYLLHPLVCQLERLRLRRLAAVLLLFALIAGAGTLGGFLLGPKLYHQGQRLVTAAPGWAANLQERAAAFLDENRSLSKPLGNAAQAANDHLSQTASRLAGSAWSTLGSLLHTLGFLLGLVFIPFYLFYFLVDQPRIERSWRDLLPIAESRLKEEVVVALEQINKYLVSFFRGQIIVAAIDGALLAVGLSLVGLDSALFIGAAAAVLTIIPYFGITITGISALLVAAYQPDGGGGRLVLMTLGVFTVVQILEGTLVSPRVMGKQTGLHPVTVILSILIWSSILGGLLGAILAVPLTATLNVLLVRYALIRKTP